MELEQIDSLLERYSAAESRIAANLVDLDGDPTYKLISNRGLTGVTAQRLADAVQAAPLLWGWFVALQDALTTARTMRGTGRMSNIQRQQLGQFLTGNSVDPDASSVLGGASGSAPVSIEALLTRIREAYEPVRDGIAEVDTIWRDLLPRTEAAKATLARATADLERLGMTDYSIRQANEHLATIEAALLEDPLRLDASSGEELDRLVAEAARIATTFRKGHDDLDGDLAEVGPLLGELRLLRSRAAAARAETQLKIKDATGLVHIPSAAIIDGPGGLTERADTLRDSPALQWQARRQQLDAWLSTAQRLRRQLMAADTANAAPLARRDELRGLLSAYQAKLAAIGFAEEPIINDLHDAAYNELFTKPTDVERAAVLVEQVGDALRSSGGSLPNGGR